MIQGFHDAPLGLVLVYLVILCPFFLFSQRKTDKQIRRTALPSLCIFYLVCLRRILTPKDEVKMTSLLQRACYMRRHAIKYTPRSLWHFGSLCHCCGPCSCCDRPFLLWLTARSHQSDNQKEDEVTGTSTCMCECVRMPKNERHSRLCFVSPRMSVFSNTHRHARADLWAFRQANCTEKLLERWRMCDFIGGERERAHVRRTAQSNVKSTYSKYGNEHCAHDCVNWICQR